MKNEIEIIHQKEKEYSEELRDFINYWYFGERFKYSIFSGYVNAAYKSKTLNISRLGFRGKEFPKKNLSNIKRVALFGSSGLLGIPVANDNNNITAYSNNFFKSNALNCESLDFGVISARIGSEMKLITKTIIEYDFDYVVLMSGWNDACSYTLGSLWEYQDISDIYNLGFTMNKNFDSPLFHLKNFLKSIKRKIEIAQLKKKFTKEIRGPEKYFRKKRSKIIDKLETVPIFNQGEKLYLQVLNQIIDLCNYHKKTFIYLFQPSLFATSKELSIYETAAYRRQNNFFGETEEKKNYRIDQFKKFYNNFGKKCSDLVVSKGSYIIDLDKKFSLIPRTTDLFYDESHYFETGNKIIGEEISKFISKNI